MVSDLADQHDIHSFIRDGWGSGAGDRGGKAAGPGKCGGRAAQLQSDRFDADSPPCSPANRGPRQVAQAGAEIQQRKSLPGGTRLSVRLKPKRTAAAPPNHRFARAIFRSDSATTAGSASGRPEVRFRSR